MRSPTSLLPLVLILATDIRCKDDAPTGGEFGDACGEVDTPCGEGLECYIGYCEEQCTEDRDCQPIEGFRHECDIGLCHIYCDDTNTCPQTLSTPLECIMLWCESAL